MALRRRPRARRRPLRLSRLPSPTRSWSRSATCRARAFPPRSTARLSARSFAAALTGGGSCPSAAIRVSVLTSLNRILHERGLEEYYCTLCYAVFDLKKRVATFANSGLPFPHARVRRHGAADRLPGVPLGSFGGSGYDERTAEFDAGDVFVFCSDGISETFNAAGEEFGSASVAADGARASREVGAGDRRGRSSVPCRHSAATRRKPTIRPSSS